MKVVYFKFRNRKQTFIVFKDKWEVLCNKEPETSLFIRFETKTLEFENIDKEDRKGIIEYLKYCDTYSKPFDIDCEINQTIDKAQVLKQLQYFKKYNKNDKSTIDISYGAALVLHDIIPTTHDIDLMISKSRSYMLEDCFKIQRKLAPMGNTAMQSIPNLDIDCFEQESELGVIKIFGSYNLVSLVSLIEVYKKRGREKDMEKIAIINKALKGVGNE